MSSNPSAKHKSSDSTDFRRAMGYLRPYWGMVATSIACAIFVSAAATGGLGTLLPIMRVLVKGDTIPSWAQREIAERRLGVRFADDVSQVRMVVVDPKKSAAAAGLAPYDVISLLGQRATTGE